MARIKFNKQKLLRHLLLGVAFYVLFLIIYLPASLFSGYVSGKLAAAGIQLQNVRGTLWQGEALDARIGRVALGRLKWDLSSFGLLVGNLDMDLDFARQDTQGKGNVVLGFGGGLQMHDLDVRMPAEGMGSLFSGLPVSFSGNLLGRITELDVRKGEMFKGKGRIVWQQAALVAPQAADLGDVLIELKPDNNNTRISISDQNERGQLKINLEYMINANGKYRWDGTIGPRGNTPDKLLELLKFLGSPDSNGVYRISRSGQLAGW